jgi:hypothetical protein
VEAANHAALAQAVGAGGSLIARATSVSGGTGQRWAVAWHARLLYFFPVWNAYLFLMCQSPRATGMMIDGHDWDDDDQFFFKKKTNFTKT